MNHRWLTAERSPSRIGAEFATEQLARDAAVAVRDRIRLPASNVQVITPADARKQRRFERKLEPEIYAIAHTLARAHLIIGAAGLLLGMALAGVLIAFDVAPFATSPGLAFVVIAVLGTVLGLLFGGLAEFRADHDAVLHAARSAVDAGAWYVVVHTRGPGQQQATSRILARHGTRLRTTM